MYTPVPSGTQAGSIASEQYLAATPSGKLTANNTTCSMGLPASPRYRIDHTYRPACVPRRHMRGGFLSLNQTIDARGAPQPEHGLRASTPTLSTTVPDDSSGSCPVGDGYTDSLPAGDIVLCARRRADQRRGPSQTSTPLAQSQISSTPWAGVAGKQLLRSSDWSVRETLYDAAGHKQSISEAQTGTPNRKTQFLDYDAFGRARTWRPADSATQGRAMTSLQLLGTRIVERT